MLKTGKDNQVPSSNPRSNHAGIPFMYKISKNSCSLTPPPPTHLDLLNLGMGVEELLKFCWIDVLSSPNNHVLAAPYNFAVAMLIQAPQVPAMTTPF